MSLLRADLLGERLRKGKIYCSDGAMGTELIRRGVPASEILRANTLHPDIVAEIHQEYRISSMLTANTFSVPYGPDWRENMRAGMHLAGEAVQQGKLTRGVWVSLISRVVTQESGFIHELTREASAEGYAVLIETCVRLDEAVEAARLVRKGGYDSLLAVTCHFQSEGTMPDGSEPEAVVRALTDAGADIVGGNCGFGPEMFVPIVARMRAATDAPLLFQPNAGLPHPDEQGNQVYSIEPQPFGEIGKRLFDTGANIVGGCCGATREHIVQLQLQMAKYCQVLRRL